MEKMEAIYACTECGNKWKFLPGPTQCPECYCIWVEWLNYDELNKKYFSNYWSKNESNTISR